MEIKDVYLKTPTLEDEDEWVSYVSECLNDNPDINTLDYYLGDNYESWLDYITNCSLGMNVFIGDVPFNAYFLMKDKRIIGDLSIRHKLGREEYLGHIGGCIRPSERRCGYSKKMLRLALEKCCDIGLNKVMITCERDNIGSQKSIMSNGGEFSGMFHISSDNGNSKIIKVYWIDVNKQLISEKPKTYVRNI